MNGWYNRINTAPQMPQQMPIQNSPANIMQAMMNPVAFIRSQCPDVPENILNNPNQVFQYLMNTRGLNAQQRQILNQQQGGRF